MKQGAKGRGLILSTICKRETPRSYIKGWHKGSAELGEAPHTLEVGNVENTYTWTMST